MSVREPRRVDYRSRLVDDFSRTASGKIRKVDLRAWLRKPHPAEEEAP